MKIYADKFVDSLKNTEEIIEVYGSEVVLKRSPAEVRKGYLDPYEAAALDKSEKNVREKRTYSCQLALTLTGKVI